MNHVHDLKILDKFYEAILTGEKNFVLYRDQPGYAVDDILRLGEIDETGEYTGRYCTRIVSYKLSGPFYGLESGFCIMSLASMYVVSPAPATLSNGESSPNSDIRPNSGYNHPIHFYQ